MRDQLAQTVLSSTPTYLDRFVILITLFLAGASAQQPAPQNSGASSLKNLSLEELSQIEVTTPSKEPVRAFQSPVAIYVITQDDIRQFGATSIPEALRLAPGVEVARIDGNKWSIGIRGFGTRFSRGVLVLIDGRTVYSTLLAGTYWEVQDTNMDDIDRIEVIRGPGGTIWGPNAVNGVINVITKSAAETKGLLVSAGGGNEDQGFANVRYGGDIGPDLNYRVYAKGFTRSPEDHQDSRNFDDWRSTQAGFRMDWNRGANDTLTVQGDLYGEVAGERVNPVSYTAPYSTIVDGNADLSGGNFMGRWQRTTANGDQFLVQAYYDRTNRYEPNFGEIRNTFDIDFVDHLHKLGRHQITWGLGARLSHAKDLEVVSGLTFQPDQRTDELFTAFFQDEVTLVSNRLSLTAGTKLLRTNFTDVDFEPSVRLLWTPGARTAIWGAFTHALRTPSDAEEDFYLSGYLGTAAGGLQEFARFNANPYFAPEQLNGYELGYRQLAGKRLAFDLSSFYNHYHDLFDEEITGPFSLESTPAPPHLLLPAQFGNGLLGYTKGFEIAPEWRVSERWRVHGSYSFLHMNLGKSPHSTDVGTAPGIVGASPHHEVTLQNSYQITRALQLDLTYRYVSALLGQGVPAYSTGDSRFAWRLSRELELSAVGHNLLQPRHAEFAGDPGPLVLIKRSAFLELRWGR